MSRQAFPDQLRGVALLGIIVVNAPFLGISAAGYTEASLAGWWNATAAFAVLTLAQGKFYLLFSFLFGYSALFILGDGAAARRRRYVRRLIGLAVLGVAHAVLLFIGDILLTYALLGYGLLLLVGRSDRAVVRTAVIALVVSVVWLVGIAVLLAGAPGGPDPALIALDTAFADGSFLDAARARLDALPAVFGTVLLVQGGLVFAALCVGLLAGRRGLLADLAPARAQWRRIGIWGCAFGLPLQAIAAALQIQGATAFGTQTGSALLGLALGLVTAPILAAGYLGALACLVVRRPYALDAVRDGGRASLTLYLGESIALAAIFCGWGLGLFGDLGAAAVLGIAIGVFIALSIGIRAWLARFRQGPFEALLAVWTGPRP